MIALDISRHQFKNFTTTYIEGYVQNPPGFHSVSYAFACGLKIMVAALGLFGDGCYL